MVDERKQTPSFQRWLSADAMCTLLGISLHTLHHWTRQRYIAKIGSTRNARYLDPGPEYAERLKAGRAIHMKRTDLQSDVSMKALFTVREIAEIMGWTLKYATRYVSEKKIPKHKGSYKAALFDAATVRNMVWARDRRRASKQRGPFLLSELIAFFWRYQNSQDAIMPSDSQFENDDILKKKIEMLMKQPSPHRELALKELMANMGFAKSVVGLLHVPTSLPASESAMPAAAPDVPHNGFGGHAE